MDSVLRALRLAFDEAEVKESDLEEAKNEIDDALEVIDTYKKNISEVIEVIETLTNLSCDYGFNYSLDDFDLSVDL